ncbi:hypothetical protein PUNSTDRAFT_143467 [Punctularia strigosozonata HHB-11173 SS5]|uniref:uncharacterized protein n=1 Tax=Punctularia strigosozonata (strain HHB-11173) TaxID=741275 RepID=UPI0004417917|nr:uncharacterized protein PUNSTDRAFT_143467 [Punctularia strigosozonata HHB-11173 SS5]EIN08733.1 hypothetical protein PUNSTDRAFT_143467 [Punctularia strigosozonata HHB-11173 SS5]
MSSMSGPPGSYYPDFPVPVAFNAFANPAEAVAAVVSSHAQGISAAFQSSTAGNPPGSHGIAPSANALLDPHNPDLGPTKHCSVRGCSVLLSANALTKMCDGCRERHREYALTKRRKRKAEKAAVLAAAAAAAAASGSAGGQVEAMDMEPVWEPQAIEPGHPTSEAVKAVVSQLAGIGPRTVNHGDGGGDSYRYHARVHQHSGSQERAHEHERQQDRDQEQDQTPWLDPALYASPGHAHSSSSELAGALTLPTLHSRPSHSPAHHGHNPAFAAGGHAHAYNDHSPSPFADHTPEQIATAVAATFAAVAANAAGNPNALAGSSTSTSAAGSANNGSSHLPPRYCSVKGCKVLVPGDYLYKMCEACRDRYRNYGNTKRAKWKAQSTAARTHLALLDKVREEEEKRRAENGLESLGTLGLEEQRAWEERVLRELKMQLPPDAFVSPDPPPPPPHASDSLDGQNATADQSMPGSSTADHDSYAQAGPSSAPTAMGISPIIRMCSVSHCKALLPATHKYRRCEAHRVQNRMHSRLKRDREIERKTKGNRELMETLGGMPGMGGGGGGDGSDGGGVDPGIGIGVGVGEWALETGGNSGMGNRYIVGRGSSTAGEDGDGAGSSAVIPMADPQEHQLPQEYDDRGVPIPPAIRGARRTNFVCSVAKCFNLLSPRSPWKMCDGCRERDREVRGRLEKLRKEGVEVCATRGCKELLRLKEIKGGIDKLRFCEQCLKAREETEKEKEEKARAREEREQKAKERREERDRMKEEKEKDREERVRERVMRETIEREAIERSRVQSRTSQCAEEPGGSASEASMNDDTGALQGTDPAPETDASALPKKPSQKARAALKRKAEVAKSDSGVSSPADTGAAAASSSEEASQASDEGAASATPIVCIPRVVKPPPPSGTFAYGTSLQNSPPPLPPLPPAPPPPAASAPPVSQPTAPPYPVTFYAPHPYGMMPPYAVQGPNGETYPPPHAYPYGFPMPPHAFGPPGSPPSAPAGTAPTGKDGSPSTSPPMVYPPYPYPFYQYPPPQPGASTRGYTAIPLSLPTASSDESAKTKASTNAAEVQWSPFAPQPVSALPMTTPIPTGASAGTTHGTVGRGLIWAEVRTQENQPEDKDKNKAGSRERAKRRKVLLTDEEAVIEQARIMAASAQAAPKAQDETTATEDVHGEMPPEDAAASTTFDAPFEDPSATKEETHTCGNKLCSRPLPANAVGTLCNKCKARLKKRQTKAKQKFHLEPRRAIVATPST